MEVLIENYRGWEITFNTYTESFTSTSDEYDSQTTKKTYTSAKKSIDDFIKDNSTFKPIMVERIVRGEREVKNIVGIRKDGDFVYEDEAGKKHRLSSYNEKNYYLVNEDNEPIFDKIKGLETAKQKLINEIKGLEETLNKVSLLSIKEKYIK